LRHHASSAVKRMVDAFLPGSHAREPRKELSN
jgi:hypothetical protein